MAKPTSSPVPYISTPSTASPFSSSFPGREKTRSRSRTKSSYLTKECLEQFGISDDVSSKKRRIDSSGSSPGHESRGSVATAGSLSTILIRIQELSFSCFRSKKHSRNDASLSNTSIMAQEADDLSNLMGRDKRKSPMTEERPFQSKVMRTPNGETLSTYLSTPSSRHKTQVLQKLIMSRKKSSTSSSSGCCKVQTNSPPTPPATFGGSVVSVSMIMNAMEMISRRREGDMQPDCKDQNSSIMESPLRDAVVMVSTTPSPSNIPKAEEIIIERNIEHELLNDSINNSLEVSKIVDVLDDIGEQEGIKLPHHLALQIADNANQNLRHSVRLFEASWRLNSSTKDPISMAESEGEITEIANSIINVQKWEEDVCNIAKSIINEQSPKQLYVVRRMLLDLIEKNVAAESVFRTLVVELKKNLNAHLQPKIDELCVKFNMTRQCNASRYMRIEEFIAKFMSFYKRSQKKD